jgi:intracellular sulfur oxidation DsrE/DsrF family protein
MGSSISSPRRGFLSMLAGLPIARLGGATRQSSPQDEWLTEVKVAHRCLFDFPQHKNGVPLLHILNYLNTYATAYKLPAGQAGAVGTLYGIGGQASIPFGFNDAMWEKYALGDYTGLKDSSGVPYKRNVLYRPTKDDAHILMQAMQTPPMPGLAEAVPAMGIESLQKMGTKFLMCNNALGAWCMELEARGKGKMPDIDKDLRANLLPGVTLVPAMVIAIEKAQAAGVRYNRQ